MALSKILPASQEQYAGARNLIINGAAQINQRGAIAAGATDSYFADRWSHIHNGTSARVALDTSTDVPSGEGFNKSLKIDVSTADTTPTGTNYMILRQVLEGQDLIRLKKGTSSAESLTLSFWVKSSVTGTYIAELFDLHNTRQISKTYTVSTANTWEKKTITFPGDTSGAFTYDNSGGLSVQWWLLAGGDFTSGTLNDSAWAASTNANRVVGQVNLFASTSNEFYMTGVQLEVGEATPFEHRSYADELQRCQRYYFKTFDPSTAPAQNISTSNVVFVGGNTGLSTAQKGFFSFPVQMRANPTLITYNPYASNSSWRVPSTSTDVTPTVAGSRQSVDVTINSSSYSSAHGHLTADAEL